MPSDDAPSLELVRCLLAERAPAGLEARALHWSSYFHIHHRHVGQLRSGRIFIAGDAAHIHSPFGGQGMNTGLHDVWNLVWKLDLVRHGHDGERLLDSYGAERLPVITSDHGDQNVPTWSHDGDWIYFSWRQGSAPDVWQRDIWRVRVRSGSKEQVTRGGGGYVGHESADGKALLYQPTLRTSPMMAQALAGGPPKTIVACARGTAVAVTDDGIYYVPCSATSAPSETTPLRMLDPGSGEDREVARLEQYVVGLLSAGLAVSPDGKTILYTRTVSSGADLMMIENFK